MVLDDGDDHVHPTQSPNYSYPFAPSPDILRTHQKDVYLTSTLNTQASSILRSLLGARFAHRHSTTTSHLTELLYLSLTTLLGNRTLGEEYCDVVQIEDDTHSLASLPRRFGYISSVVFAPWILSRALPALRRRVRAKLERNIERAKRKPNSTSSANARSLRVQEYILTHIDSLTSLSPIYAVSLATFYFTGNYYHLSKRLFSLRYTFTKSLKENEQRIGYEVLGVLLVLQLAVQSALHVRETLTSQATATSATDSATAGAGTSAVVGNGVEIDLDTDTTMSGTHLLNTIHTPSHLPTGLASTTQTPILPIDTPRYALSDPQNMAFIPAGQQRKCTLCLEPFRDPAATSCGHVFCWTCVQDWVKEKAECPLCRQAVLSQKILPLRGYVAMEG